MTYNRGSTHGHHDDLNKIFYVLLQEIMTVQIQ